VKKEEKKRRPALIRSAFIAVVAFSFSAVAAPPQQADSERFKRPTLFSPPPHFWGD
jgi:hypothetical protein